MYLKKITKIAKISGCVITILHFLCNLGTAPIS